MTIKSHGGRVIPEKGIEQASITLMHACTRARTRHKPQYLNAVYAGEFDLACEIINDMGYGQTRSEVQAVVWDVYNEHGKNAWEQLAIKLAEIHRGGAR